MTNILSIDSSKKFYEISITDNEQDVVSVVSDEPNKHSENLIPEIESLLESSSLSYQDIDVIAVNVGPGSFTSIRAGIAIAIGVNLVNQTSLVAVTSFESIAYQALNKFEVGIKGDILVVIDAKREQLFIQILDNNLNSVKEPKLIFYDELNDYYKDHDISMVCGDGVEFILENIDCKKLIIFNNLQSNSKSILNIAKIKFNNSITPKTLTPLYIRKPDAKKQIS